MNLILLDSAEIRDDGTVRIEGRRAAHVLTVLRPTVGDALQVGVIGGRVGTGTLLSSDGRSVVLRIALEQEPPPRAPVDLLLALPRPKILRRVLRAAASMGVARIVLLGSYRVEKSYFASPLLSGSAVESELRLGLEQARDTRMPEVILRRFFKPFVEDELEQAFTGSRRLLADPLAQVPLEALQRDAPRAVIAIGPEGGWTRYETDQLVQRGFAPFTLGQRILRVDTAVSYVMGQVELWLRRPPA